MSESPQNTRPNPSSQEEEEENITRIPIEFISEEEMALIEAAYAATRSSVSSSSSSACSSTYSPIRFQSKPRSIQSTTLSSKRSLNDPCELGHFSAINSSDRKKTSESPQNTPPNTSSQEEEEEVSIPSIPVEFVSEDEMALIGATYAATRSSLFPSASTSSVFSSICSPFRFQCNTRSIQSITLFSKRIVDCSSELNIEDFGNLRNTQKRTGAAQPQTFLHRFRSGRGLSVTDITSTVWKL